MAKPNYNFEKRQKDLKRKQKQEEKRQRKLAARHAAKEGQSGAPEESPDSAEARERGDTPPADAQS